MDTLNADLNATDELLSQILAALRNENATTRLESIRQLQKVAASNPAILHQLERLALSDPSKKVRAEALAALDSPIYRHLKQKISGTTLFYRKLIVTEIETWVKDGLVPPEQAQVLRLTPAPAPTPAPP